jgi:hypothetical protein
MASICRDGLHLDPSDLSRVSYLLHLSIVEAKEERDAVADSEI